MSLKLVIAGAGNIGRSTALLGRYFFPEAEIFVGDMDLERAREVAALVEGEAYVLPEEGLTEDFLKLLSDATVLVDCLPGKEADRMAEAALRTKTHYINLTEHIQATESITRMVREAGEVPVGFVLQAGLAPGFINVLAVHLASVFEARFGVHPADVRMRVGALTPRVSSPHFYAITWSSMGVAVEYVKPSVVIREGRRTLLPALSEPETLVLNGKTLEADLTSGGAASTPEFFEGKVARLDYKTLRWPGHFRWVRTFLSGLPEDLSDEARIQALHEHLVNHIPVVEEDWVVAYAAVLGKDRRGTLRQLDRLVEATPRVFGGHRLTAIQATTTAGALQALDILLADGLQGVIFQTDLPPDRYLGGRIVREVYGDVLDGGALPGAG